MWKWKFWEREDPPQEVSPALALTRNPSIHIEILQNNQLQITTDWPPTLTDQEGMEMARRLSLTILMICHGQFSEGFCQSLNAAGEWNGMKGVSDLAVHLVEGGLAQTQGSHSVYVPRPHEVFPRLLT